MQMTCPKCHGDMRVYERSGVTVDQCTECRGIFLDRGELEKLFEAETNWNNQQAPGAPPRPQQPAGPPPGGYAPPPPAPPAPGGYPQQPPGYPPQPGYGQPQPGYQQGAPAYGQGGYGHHGHYHNKRKKKSFLNELFD
ncbi:TFIIB-type zinc ribbon-containing protein [Jidongwangia harbinensis]|uniref:TFIIB-type zinc ribbon-containing protein n=1 Tax=Jidongwangia harbinensis TaxID=2878561 RepID=UPI001CD967E7|nr:zf-TFIIB domain-containing protein [Jidongwangia harbinensis]MCA2212696.1 zf-TFIIB domain-containing protein [Jidongwangia harbinensis]